MITRLRLLLAATLCVLLFMFLAGCSSPYEYATYPCSTVTYQSYSPPPVPQETIWQPDKVGAYTVGRTVDPRDPNVVHEAHTVYRREETSRPNLTPPVAAVTPPAALAATNVSTLMRDVLTAELNQQRATSQALTREARALNERLTQLNSQTQDMRDSLQDSARVRAQLTAVTNRLEVIETQLRRGSATSTNRAGSRP